MANALEHAAERTMQALKATQATFQGLTGVFAKLVREHGELSALLKRLKRSSDEDAQRRLYPEVRERLLAHERAEKAEVYRELGEREMTRRLAMAHEDQSQELEAALLSLSRLEFGTEEWGRGIELLTHRLEQHVFDEEGDYFPRAQTELGEQDVKDLERRYEVRHEQELASLRSAAL